ncbi:MAG: hypothetical protein ACFCUX_03325 [Candidatus Methylacidiphilales bacterium]
MNFLDLPERINRLLYRKEIVRLSPRDRLSAKSWTLKLIRDSHPQWSDEEVEKDYQRLEQIRVIAVDAWGKRHRADL